MIQLQCVGLQGIASRCPSLCRYTSWREKVWNLIQTFFFNEGPFYGFLMKP